MRKFIKSNSFLVSKKAPTKEIENALPEEVKNTDYSSSNYVKLLKNHEKAKQKFTRFF